MSLWRARDGMSWTRLRISPKGLMHSQAGLLGGDSIMGEVQLTQSQEVSSACKRHGRWTCELEGIYLLSYFSHLSAAWPPCHKRLFLLYAPQPAILPWSQPTLNCNHNQKEKEHSLPQVEGVVCFASLIRKVTKTDMFIYMFIFIKLTTRRK